MKYYKYLNLNPLGEHTKDCVCRAISLGLDEDYDVIEYKLYLIAKLFECDTLCVCCYKHLLDNVYGLERIDGYRGITIKEFLKENQRGIYIIRVHEHLTCAINGTINDIWDCTNEIIDIIWFVE